MLTSIQLALSSLLRHPLRTSLTVLGLLIGVAAFIAMLSFATGARRSVVSQFEKLGVNVLTISPAGPQLQGGPPSPLSDRDVEALRLESDIIQYVVPLVSADVLVIGNGRQATTPARGTGPRYAELGNWSFHVGGMFNEADVAEANKVCVLGDYTATKLFGTQEPLGEIVLINQTLPCRVIGVLASKGFATSGRDLDRVLLMPATTFNTHLFGRPSEYFSLLLRPYDGIAQTTVRSVVKDSLRASHRLEPQEPDDFKVKSNDDAITVVKNVSAILTSLMGGIAAVSLLVGGIGIMNIQLVGVAERTQEIGIRSAIGATPAQIMQQFLTEAVVLALVGTFLGALIGIAVSLVVAAALDWPPGVPLYPVAIAIIFGGGVGIFFGYVPAKRAANMEPVDALRRE